MKDDEGNDCPNHSNAMFLQLFYFGQASPVNYFIPKWEIIKGHASAKAGAEGLKSWLSVFLFVLWFMSL